MPKDKYEPPSSGRQHRILQRTEIAEGRQTQWSEMEIFGQVRNLSCDLWKMSWLTVLYLDNNQLSHLPPQIGCLMNLEHLDASYNHLEHLPREVGELVHLRELKLANNHIRELPCELGKCFQIQTLGESAGGLAVVCVIIVKCLA
ncbi:Ccr4-not transcription complex subunit 6-like [Plakobranchus ocellatus]|uniref:Ccr4-not transcription complex subunit 6-like n=1 Tax=Plakobranchus ocellatus TaxID=259542 RepID=A0AAV4AC16_9GAST|nr:Ccr4-not transcription complex subunit 6-like [Plakobranchus ocellatus]